MSDDTRVKVSDAAAPTDNAHVAQDSSKPKLSKELPEKNTNAAADQVPEAKEFGGQAGPEPTRYGDWEKNGRVSDF